MAPRKSAAAAASVASPRRSARLKHAQSSVNFASGDESLEATIPHTPLDIPELLENILMNLPLRDIVFSRRVCRMWQEEIKQSPNIQEVLFLRTTSDTTITAHLAQPPSARFREMHWCKHGGGAPRELAIWTNECKMDYRPIGNPLLGTYVLGNAWGVEHRPLWELSDGIHPQSLQWKSLSQGTPAILGRMFLSHPPIREIEMIPPNAWESQGDDDDSDFVRVHDDVRVYNATGLTMQDLADRLRMHRNDCVKCLKRTPRDDRWGMCGALIVQQPKDGITGWEMLTMLRAAS
ncbi:hypothetical protein LTR17_021962 [Elasticomyces elasticus]|nr:hypothetical protein LTR17_021962 [Elasticomyces elasticus]